MKSIQHFIRQSFLMFMMALLGLSIISLIIYTISLFKENTKRLDEVSFRIGTQAINGVRNARNNILVAETTMLDQVKKNTFDQKHISKILASSIFYNTAQFDIYYALSEKYSRRLKNAPPGQMILVKRNNYANQTESTDINKIESSFSIQNFQTHYYSHDLYHKKLDEVWYQAPLKNHGKLTYVGLYFDKNYTKKWLFSLTKAIFDEKKEVIGVIGIDYAFDVVADIFKNFSAKLGFIIFQDNDGRIVMHHPSKELALIPPDPHFSLYINAIDKTKDELIGFAKSNSFSIQRFNNSWVFYKTYQVPLLPWHVLVYQSAIVFCKGLISFVAILGIVLFVFLGSFFYFFRKKSNELLPPLQNLLESLERDVSYLVKNKSIIGKYNESNVVEISEIVKCINTLFEVANENFQNYQAELIKNVKNLEQLETLVKKRSEQLIEREKLASLGVMTAGLAHEIKNPLNLICSAAEIVDMQLQRIEESALNLEESSSEKLKRIKDSNQVLINNAKRVDNIVKTLLMQASNDKTLINQKVNIEEIILSGLNFVLTNNRPKINNRIEIEFRKLQSPFYVVGNISEFGRVFINIFDNCVYSILKNMGQIESFRGKIDIHLKRIQNGVEISICDNGAGANKYTLSNVFTPFFTTKAPGEGTGLGLSFVYDYIKAHNGTIEIKAKENEYFEIIIFLEGK